VKSVFDNIQSPQDIQSLSLPELTQYASHLRQALIEQIAVTGGHFAANLGVIELSIALHKSFNAPHDIMVWDVGHQAYAHKWLTGRKSEFNTLRQFGGLSGFPKMSESPYDAFGTGHSSTSISAVLGYAEAAKLQGIDRAHIAIIGDGALSAGQAFEALNNAGTSLSNITVILNDNHIGIDPSQGALGDYLNHLNAQNDNFFTDLGLQYWGPVDGHSIADLLAVFETSKSVKGPKIIHIKTIKGKGYAPAEMEQTKWHSTSQFDKLTGKATSNIGKGIKYQDVFGQTLSELAELDSKIVAVTPAMISGSSLHYMQEKMPDRVFDVGIAEQHALTFSAGLAASGLKPVCSIYSTFLQRGMDQWIHDIALQNLPVILAVDRSGLVGEDGPTHHGVFDLAMLQSIPNTHIICPSNAEQLRQTLYTAVTHTTGPIVIRYPRGNAGNEYQHSPFKSIDLQASFCVQNKTSTLGVIAVGSMVKHCLEALKDIEVAVYDLFCVKPLNQAFLDDLMSKHKTLLIVEENSQIGGVGAHIAQCLAKQNPSILVDCMGIPDNFVQHGSMDSLYQNTHLSVSDIKEKAINLLNN
jgi:1-deoxy-D-xylulose-5-phosphate synthase